MDARNSPVEPLLHDQVLPPRDQNVVTAHFPFDPQLGVRGSGDPVLFGARLEDAQRPPRNRGEGDEAPDLEVIGAYLGTSRRAGGTPLRIESVLVPIPSMWAPIATSMRQRS